MQLSRRRVVALWTSRARSFSNAPSSSGDAPANTPQESSEEHVFKQCINLKEELASVQAGHVLWKSRHKLSDKEARAESLEKQGVIATVRQHIQWSIRYMQNHARHHINALLLPTGYPDSVKPNYDRFITAQAITSALSNTNSILASTYLLYAVGMGTGAAVPVSGALNWIIKDGFGQLGTLMFGRMIAHDFDINTRTWNFWATVTLNIACIVEICTVWFPEHFLLLGSLANMIKGLSWMAGGATRAAFNVSFAKGENIADLTAKNTSQFICTSLIGTTMGALIASQVQSDASSALAWSSVLAVISLMAAWSTIRAVPLSTLNHTRMQLLIDQYLRINADGYKAAPVALETPSTLCLADPVIYIPSLSLDHRFRPNIEVGTALSSLLRPDCSNVDVKLLRTLEVHRDRMHLIVRDGRHRESRVHVILHEDAKPPHAIEAMLHAVMFRKEIKKCAADVIAYEKEMDILVRTRDEARRHSACLQDSMRQATWNLDRVCVENFVCRGRW